MDPVTVGLIVKAAIMGVEVVQKWSNEKSAANVERVKANSDRASASLMSRLGAAQEAASEALRAAGADEDTVAEAVGKIRFKTSTVGALAHISPVLIYAE